jgi:predicted membrane protein
MKYLDEFLTVFGDITIGELVVFLLALGFLYAIYKEFKKFNDQKAKERQEKLEAEKAEKKKINEAWEVTQKYPAYHQESIAIREGLEKEIQELKDDFKTIMDRLNEIEEQNKKRGFFKKLFNF